jgi:hypothetical protein
LLLPLQLLLPVLETPSLSQHESSYSTASLWLLLRISLQQQQLLLAPLAHWQ